MFHTPWLDYRDYPAGETALGWLIAICPMAICIILGLTHALRNANVEGWQVSSLVLAVFPSMKNSATKSFVNFKTKTFCCVNLEGLRVSLHSI